MKFKSIIAALDHFLTFGLLSSREALTLEKVVSEKKLSFCHYRHLLSALNKMFYSYRYCIVVNNVSIQSINELKKYLSLLN